MAKPIFIIRTKYNREVLDWLNSDTKETNELRYDYHTLVVYSNEPSEPQFEVLNAINATDIELEELKARVLTQLIEKKDVEQS